MDQVNIGERIKKRREENGLSLQDVADQLDVNRSSVMRWENGETSRIKLPIVEKLAQILQTSPGYLMGYKNFDDSVTASRICSAEDACYLPVLKNLSLTGNLFEKPNVSHYELSESCYRYKPCFYFLTAEDSMAPRLEKGDRLLVLQQNSLENGQLGVFILDEKTCIIREYYRKNSLELRAFNPYYPVLTFSKEEEGRIQIVGRVLESKRKW